MTQDTWGQVRGELIKSVGKNNYVTWIEPLKFSGLKQGVARFEAPTTFIGDWVSRNFSEAIRQQLISAGAEVERVEFSVPLSSRPNAVQMNGTPPTKPSTGRWTVLRHPDDDELPGAPLDARFTFDSFVVGKPNELAHAAARRVAEGGPVTFNPLFLYGGVGLGKTHLMHAIAHELQKQKPEARVLYLSAEQFMYRFIQALREKQIMDFKGLFRSVDVLMVDDVQFIAGKESTQEEFFHTFNALHQSGKQIVISSDRPPKSIPTLHDRLRSRFEGGLLADVQPPDLETREAILPEKGREMGVEVPYDIVEYVARKVQSNIRELEGALNKVIALGLLHGRPLTMELAVQALTDTQLEERRRQLTPDRVIDTVIDYYRVSREEIAGKGRRRDIVVPRQVAMYLIRSETGSSLVEIGNSLGGRDHSTIVHGIEKVERQIDTDQRLRTEILAIRERLYSAEA
jgi:chromosomal replication initiator protein